MNRLIVFVKAPRPGFTKTRLATALGAEEAARVAVRLADRLFENLNSLVNVELRYAPDDARAEVQRWTKDGWLANPQGGGSLGERLQRSIDEAFRVGSRRVAVIGSDCPYVMPDDIDETWRRLEAHDVVLGPAKDGGYWLIGLRASHPRFFDDIHWSSPVVLKQTQARSTELGLSVSLLDEYSDIDTAEDWHSYRDLQEK